jgi:CheY-like chemotaxis protein
MTDQAIGGPDEQSSYRKRGYAIVVDSYAKDLFMTGMMLQRLDHDVYIVNTAEDALRIVEAANPTLIITELALPQMSGLELLIRIKHEAKTKTLPVVIYTSGENDKKKELCRASGCAAYLRKPLDPVSLYSAIQEATEIIPRQFIRLRTLLPVMVGGASASTRSLSGMEYVSELSESGIFVRTLNPRPVNSMLPVTLIIRSMQIKLKAMVVHTVSLAPGLFREPGMGMKFVEITATDREVLRNVIKGQILKDIAG